MGNFSTDFLVPSGSFVIGAGTVLALGGNYYEFNSSTTPEEADSRAMRSDFGVISEDIRKASEKYISIQDPNE